MLTPLQRQLWALTYSCLYMHNCPVMFELIELSIDTDQQMIIFFVPRHVENAQEVIEYLSDELAEHNRHTKLGELIIPHASVHVVEFDGIEFYQTAQQIETVVNNLIAKIKG